MPEPVRSLLTVSVNGQQFTASELDFDFYNVSVARITPQYTIHDGAQLINLTIPGLVNFTHVACKFDAHRPRESLALGFNDSIGVDRWYGTALVPGTLRGGDTLSCITPSASDAAVSRSLHLDFSDPTPPPGVALVGSAHIDGGMLLLTRAMHHEHGAIILTGDTATGTTPWPWARFELRMRVYVGDGEWFCTYDEAKGGRVCGGEGFSLSYGALPTGNLGQTGAGKGLRVAFRTGPRGGPAIDVTYDNELVLHSSLLPAGWPRGVWVSVRVGYDTYDSPGGLVLERDGRVDFRSLVLSGWAPQSSWQMAIAAHTGLAVDRHMLDNVTLSTDSLIKPARVEVEVTLNGQQFTSDLVPVVYDAPITISHYSPTSGPLSGDTRVVVHGFMFDHGLTYHCKFNESVVPAEFNSSEAGTIICPHSPAIASGEWSFAISLDHDADHTPQAHWYSHRDWYAADMHTPFVVYEGSTVALQPTGGPIRGATSVLVMGSGLGTGSDYRCRYA
jgi:hypothetical protein